MLDAKLFLCALLGVSLPELEEALSLTAGYTPRRIPKRDGTSRRLSVPPPALMDVQRRILTRLLYRLPLQPSLSSFPHFHGFNPGMSIVSNAAAHSALCRPKHNHPRYVLRIDLENAFDRTTTVQFDALVADYRARLLAMQAWSKYRRLLRAHRRTPHVPCPQCQLFREAIASLEQKYPAYELSNLRWFVGYNLRQHPEHEFWTTVWRAWLRRPPGAALPGTSALPDVLEVYDGVADLLRKLCFHRGRLPQGAPTSPYLLNLVLSGLGLPEALENLSHDLADEWKQARGCDQPGWAVPPFEYYRFTLYADDITVSSIYPLASVLPGDPRSVAERIIAAVESLPGLRVNRRKVWLQNGQKTHLLVTGLRLTPKGIALPKKRIRWLRSYLHHHRGNPAKQAEVQGHLAFLRMVYGRQLPKQLWPKGQLDLFVS